MEKHLNNNNNWINQVIVNRVLIIGWWGWGIRGILVLPWPMQTYVWPPFGNSKTTHHLATALSLWYSAGTQPCDLIIKRCISGPCSEAKALVSLHPLHSRELALYLRGGYREDQYYFDQVQQICVVLLLLIQEDFPKREETLALVVTQNFLLRLKPLPFNPC